MKSPSFQFYPTDYLGSQRVQMMTLEEEGAYCRLMWSCWQHGSIPSDPELAAKLVGKGCSTTVARVVLPMFEIGCGDGRVTHDRLELERAKQAEWREKSAEGGRKSAKIRKGGSTTVPTTLQPPYQPPYQPNGNTPPSCLLSSLTELEREEPLRTQSPRKPESMQECLAVAGRIGVSEQMARDWYRDCEECQWKRGDGSDFDNWQRQLVIHRDKMRHDPKKNGGSRKPSWKAVEDIESAIEQHPANPDWAGYKRANVTDELREELHQLRGKLAEFRKVTT